MFLSPRRESKPRPFDLRWDALTIEPYQDEAVYYSPQPFDLWSDALTIEPYQDEAVYYSPLISIKRLDREQTVIWRP